MELDFSLIKNKLKLNSSIYDELDPYLIMMAFSKSTDDLPEDLKVYYKNKYHSMNYERLEFIGDSLLELLVAELITLNNLKNIDKVRVSLTNNIYLSCIAHNMELCHTHIHVKQCADYVEALIGAVYTYLKTVTDEAFNELRLWYYDFFNIDGLTESIAKPSKLNNHRCLKKQITPNMLSKNEIDFSDLMYLEENLRKKNISQFNLGAAYNYKKVWQLVNNIKQFLNLSDQDDIDPFLLVLSTVKNPDINFSSKDKYAFNGHQNKVSNLMLKKYGTNNSYNLIYLGKNVYNTIMNDFLYFKIDLASPGDFTKLNSIIKEINIQNCFLKKYCRELKYHKNFQCRDTIFSVFGALYYYYLYIDLEHAYERMKQYILRKLSIDDMLKDILSGNYETYGCFAKKFKELITIASFNQEINFKRLNNENIYKEIYDKMNHNSPLFKKDELIDRERLINNAISLKLDLNLLKVMDNYELQNIINLNKSLM